MSRIDVQDFDNDGSIFVGPGNLALVSGFNNSASTRYLQLFDLAAPPTLGAIPKRSIIVPGVSNFSYAPSAQAAPYAVGLAWGVSSTPDTFTSAAELFWVAFEGNTQ